MKALPVFGSVKSCTEPARGSLFSFMKAIVVEKMFSVQHSTARYSNVGTVQRVQPSGAIALSMHSTPAR